MMYAGHPPKATFKKCSEESESVKIFTPNLLPNEMLRVSDQTYGPRDLVHGFDLNQPGTEAHDSKFKEDGTCQGFDGFLL